MASYNPYAPSYGDPNSLYPRAYAHLTSPPPEDYWSTPSMSISTSRSSRSAPHSPVWAAYTDAYLPPDPAFDDWNAAAPVPHGVHAFYGPGTPIAGSVARSRARPAVYSQTALACGSPRARLEDGQRARSRRGRLIRGSHEPHGRNIHNLQTGCPSPAELCTFPSGQVPHRNLFALPSTSSRSSSSRSCGPPFIVPRTKLPATLSRAWRRLWS
ncbi:hypothetical protein BDV93DRAFT_185907 [Ceratobasidium sp. AG-I]|nr:hypothetical protein BDV93DRAFT_185907 [Ceratobasidium sp. AG-I]